MLSLGWLQSHSYSTDSISVVSKYDNASLSMVDNFWKQTNKKPHMDIVSWLMQPYLHSHYVTWQTLLFQHNSLLREIVVGLL